MVGHSESAALRQATVGSARSAKPPLQWTVLRVACGIFLTVFAVLALSGPGRIDIVDGQTRYEVARSLVDHGDHAVRDEHIWFGRFPGRDGKDHTNYRFPQSALGVLAIVASDSTGPATEARRHAFFALTSAAAAASLAVVYFTWFLGGGMTPRGAAAWAMAGIACTPAWFYGTSTFDDILGSLAVVAALACAGSAAGQPGPRRAVIAGLLVGLAFNCKQPLGAFILPVVAFLTQGRSSARKSSQDVLLACAGLGAGIAVYAAYEAYKFPPGLEAAHAALQLLYIPIFPGKPLTNLSVLAISPSAGVLWYCPPAILGVAGWRMVSGPARTMFLVSVWAFVLFIASMTIFKGDPAWGPRYLTPVFAALWLCAPRGAAAIGRRWTRGLLLAGLLVQALAVSVDPHRLYVERSLPSAFGAVAPLFYFDASNAHLLNRPREIAEIWRARFNNAPRFSPSPAPTFAFPVLDRIVPSGTGAIKEFKLLNSFRPWWASQIYLPPAQRPVSIVWGVSLQLSLLLVGLALIGVGSRPPR